VAASRTRIAFPLVRLTSTTVCAEGVLGEVGAGRGFGGLLRAGAVGVGLGAAVGLADGESGVEESGSIDGLGSAEATVEMTSGGAKGGACPVVEPRPIEFATMAPTIATPVTAMTTLAATGMARPARGSQAACVAENVGWEGCGIGRST
jgi:hypothetical protein